jgi:hypothetical protein
MRAMQYPGKLSSYACGLTAHMIRSATISVSSCVQKRSTYHPRVESMSVLRWSRAMFPSIFLPQYCGFVLGRRQCAGHPCQKQPSMKTAILALRKTMSAVQAISRTGRVHTRKRSPRLCVAERTASSGRVSRERFPCMTRRTAGELAQDAAFAALTDCVTKRSVGREAVTP